MNVAQPVTLGPLQRLAGAESLLVAVDFDGTIAPLVDIPSEARALPDAVASLGMLAGLPDTRVAIVSGRSLTDLLTVAPDVKPAVLVGSHGAEFNSVHESSSMRYSPELSDAQHATLQEISSLAAEFLEDVPGGWIEQKAVGIAVHTRVADDALAAAMHESLAAEIARRNINVHVRFGHDVSEYTVTEVTKGDAIRQLRDLTGANTVLYVGDDQTDEDAFAALQPGDITVKCGKGDTLAMFQVASPTAVAKMLRMLTYLRASRP